MSDISVLLIHPPFQWGAIDRFCQPLGVLYLASALKNAGVKVTVLDLAAEGWTKRQMIEYLQNNTFSHIGITTLTPFREIAYWILKQAKKIQPEIITLVGGPHPTFRKEVVFQECSYVDHVVSGEAELAIVDIILNPTKNYYDLGCIKDIDNLPFPDRSHLRHLSYNELAGIYMGDSATMSWMRGCPWRKCRFCSRNDLTLNYRQRSPEKIIEEIAIIQNEDKYENIIVIDDSIKFSSKFVKKILKMKIKEGLDIPFWALARADHIDEEGAQLMNKANLSGIQIGLESSVPRIIDMYQKTALPPEKWADALTNCFKLGDKYNFIIIASFIVGAPTQTLEEIYQDIEFCRKSKLDIAQAFPFQYLIGSDMWKEAVENGNIQKHQYYTYNDKQWGTTPFTTEQIFTLAKEAENLINSPIVSPSRYVRLVRKFIKQRKWSVIAKNLFRLPDILKNLLVEHPYELVPEELHQ